MVREIMDKPNFYKENSPSAAVKNIGAAKLSHFIGLQLRPWPSVELQGEVGGNHGHRRNQEP
jgi:hypothetical protein